MHPTRQTALASFVICALACAGRAQQPEPLIKNGGFESATPPATADSADPGGAYKTYDSTRPGFIGRISRDYARVDGWDFSSGPPAVGLVEDVLQSGKYAKGRYAILFGLRNSLSQTALQTVQTKPGATYKVTFVARVFGTRRTGLKAYAYDAESSRGLGGMKLASLSGAGEYGLDSTYQSYWYYFVAATARTTVAFADSNMSPDGTDADSAIDDVSVVEMPARPAVGGLVNGDFDSTTFAVGARRGWQGNPGTFDSYDRIEQPEVGVTMPGWTIAPGSTFVSILQSKGMGGFGTCCVAFGAGGTRGQKISQTFTTTPGAIYTLTFSARLHGVGISSVRATVTPTAGSGDATSLDVSSTPSLGAAALTGTFGRRSLTFVAKEASTTISFLDTTPQGEGASGDVWIDAVTLDDAAAGSAPAPTPTPVPQGPLIVKLNEPVPVLTLKRRRFFPSLTVKVLAADGTPVDGATVRWSVTKVGDGMFCSPGQYDTGVSLTDKNGFARWVQFSARNNKGMIEGSLWVRGAGVCEVTVSSDGVPDEIFQLTATPDE